MVDFIISRVHSFQYAFAGVKYVLRTQRNAWIHAGISLAVILLSIWLNLSLPNWAVIILTISFVWMVEFINTAIESVIDLTTPHQHPLAKVSKDVAAGAVLVAAGASIMIGLLILGPPLWARIQMYIIKLWR
jgi:diacylglycerol kinase